MSRGDHAPGRSRVARPSPLTEAFTLGLIVFAAFAMSAFVTYLQLFSNERQRVAYALEAFAWKAVASAHPAPDSPDGDWWIGLERVLDHIRLNEAMIESLEIVQRSEAGHTIVARSPATAEPILDRLIPASALGPASSIFSHGSPFEEVVAVCVASPAGRPVFALGASGRMAFGEWLLNNRSGMLSFLGIGLSAALLSAFLVYTASHKSHTAYARLAEAEKRLRDVSDAAGEYIWEVDEEGLFTFLSDRVKDVLGWSPQEMLGHHPFEYLVPGTKAAVKARSDAIIAAAEPFRDFEHPMRRKDGRSIWLSVNGVPVFDDSGRLRGYRGAALDITQRKLSEQELLREKDAAQAAAVAKSQFLAMMSHEIRTPLNSVLGYADLLAKSDLGPEQKEHLTIIRNSGDALLELLNDILEFSRADAGGESALHFESTEIRSFIRGVVGLHAAAARQKGLRLDTSFEDGMPEALEIDRARLRQVLLNLVGNAVKFTDHGRVEVRVGSAGGIVRRDHYHLRVAVVDSGPGIPVEKRSLLFQPFSQVDSSATRRHGGTGLGLVICKKIAERFHGAVYLADSSREGSEFVFEAQFKISSCPPAPEAGSGPPKGSHLPGDWQPRILVAEDNPASRKLMRALLKTIGLPCEEAANGVEAFENHGAQSFDVIFMDVQMPVMDGLTATRKIRESESATRRRPAFIIALTADAMAGDRDRCLAAGMDDYLSKPVRKEQLVEALARASSSAGRI